MQGFIQPLSQSVDEVADLQVFPLQVEQGSMSFDVFVTVPFPKLFSPAVPQSRLRKSVRGDVDLIVLCHVPSMTVKWDSISTLGSPLVQGLRRVVPSQASLVLTAPLRV